VDAARTVALFDLDRTLLHVGVDAAVLSRVLEAMTGVPGLGEQFDGKGRTERWIVLEAARMAGLPPEATVDRYRAVYPSTLREAIAVRPPSALPGAVALLDALLQRADAVIGVATGNMRANAEVKLAHARLDRFFIPLRGGFGDSHDDRAAILREAAAECGRRDDDRLVFLGDTVRDVEAALAADAVPVGVATGGYTAAQLREAGAASVLRDLRDLDRAMAAIFGG
jgi:phosphoglycolate phosphatase